MPFASFDLETHLSRRAEYAPKIACGVWAEMSDAGEIGPGAVGLRNGAVAKFSELLARPEFTFINQFFPFDIACLLEDAQKEAEAGRALEISGRYGSVPVLVRRIWDAMRAGRFIGVDVCQMLLDVAHGRLDTRETQGYGLANVCRWNDIPAEDKEETWRLFFAQLEEIAPEIWPAPARQYILEDADRPLRIYARQMQHNQRWIESYGHPVLHEAGAQTWAQTALYLTSAHGVRSNPTRVAKLRVEVEAHVAKLKHQLRHRTGCFGDQLCDGCVEPIARVGQREFELTGLAAGVLVRTDGSKDTKVAKARVHAVFQAQGRVTPMTEEKKNRKAKSAFVPQVSTEEDTMVLSGDPLLMVYSDYASSNLLLNRVEDLSEGFQLPLNCEFTSIRATGRTSSRKPRAPHRGTQQQNWPREVGARECLEPRDGCSFLWADFEAAEMHTLAQACKDEVGYSRLGELLNSGVDPHAFFAGVARLGLRGTPKEIADAVMARADKKDQRGWAKPCNFGKPGGMGNEKFITFSRKQYGVLFTLEEAEYYGRLWFEQFPEVKELHKVVKKLLGRNETCVVRLKRGGFIAGGKYFPSANNLFFQGPCAAGAKASLCHVQDECYSDTNSPLFGYRAWNMVHDEVCTEGATDRVHDAGLRLKAIMEREFNRYTPDYHTGVEVIAGDVWSKEAKPVFNKDGRLGLWIYEDFLAEKAAKRAAVKLAA